MNEKKTKKKRISTASKCMLVSGVKLYYKPYNQMAPNKFTYKGNQKLKRSNKWNTSALTRSLAKVSYVGLHYFGVGTL